MIVGQGPDTLSLKHFYNHSFGEDEVSLEFTFKETFPTIDDFFVVYSN